jgi:hypothetical protein
VADEVNHVEAEAFAIESAEVIAERAPAEVHAAWNAEGELSQVLEELGGRRSWREAAVPHHLDGHALPNLRLRPAIGPQRPVGVRVHVDEARRHCLPRRAQVTARALAREIPDRHDRVVADPDIRAPTSHAGPVDHGGALDLEVEHQNTGAAANPMTRSHQAATPRRCVSAPVACAS